MIHAIYLAKGLIDNDQTIYVIQENGQISSANIGTIYELNKFYGKLLENPKSLAQSELPPTLLAQNVTSDKGYSAFIIIRNSRVSGFH